ncbi:BlaI/MecI/CopY family transcriptional regulator [uncultured Robinsoniella sp.]|uniref:BlaI/MecI/CopY family transcriptional regulator n=1 Tax=uncultured Robinsoniella sp. TaxID=904190 RepID=UPI00374F72E8
MKKLPDAEFAVMKQVWECEQPVTAPMLMERMGDKGWKAQTLISLLIRLSERGFLESEKRGRERIYWTRIQRDEYLAFETQNFVETHHSNSISSLMASLYDGGKLDDNSIGELEKWLAELEKR